MTPSSAPSHFKTVQAILKILTQELSDTSVNPHAIKACRALPKSRPAARLFMAWEDYYRNPDPRREALLAIDGR